MSTAVFDPWTAGPPKSGERRTPPIVVFDCHAGGLANRLRALVGYAALSQIRGARYFVCWHRLPRCDASWDDLFEPAAFEQISPVMVRSLQQAGEAEVFRSVEWFDAIWRKHAGDACSWLTFAAAVRAAFQQLRPRRHILDAVNRFAESHRLDHATGLHIRHTDNLAYYAQWSAKPSGGFRSEHISTLAGFEAVLRRARVNQPCFVATDDDALERSLLDRYGQVICTYPKAYGSTVTSESIRATSIEAAFVEMLLLARCHRIVGTYYSSFSKLSALWTGVAYWEIRGAACVRHRGIESAQIALGQRRTPLWRRWLPQTGAAL